MSLIKKYLVVARDVGRLDPVEDEEIIAEVVKTVKTVAESVSDLQSFSSELKSQLITKFDKNVDAQVAGVGETIFAKIHGIGGSFNISSNQGSNKIVVRAQPVKGVQSLLVMAAYNVASHVKFRANVVEVLEIPDVLKKLVNKFTTRSSSDGNEGVVKVPRNQKEDKEQKEDGEQKEDKVQEEFSTGSLKVLSDAMKNNTQILIHCCKNKSLLGRVKAFDRHCNMVLERVKEMRTEYPKTKKGDDNSKPMGVTKMREISKMFLRGDFQYCIAATRPSLS